MTRYYVDFDNGSDANNGTAESTPWKHAPEMAEATGVAASGIILANDAVYVKGTSRGTASGTNYWLMSSRYSSGATILPWSGEDHFLVDGAGLYDRVFSLAKRINMSGARATGSKADVATSCGFRFAAGSQGSIFNRCHAYKNGRFGFYGNNVAAAANLVFNDCLAYENTTLPTDNSGNGRFAAGWNLDGTGQCRLVRCSASRNGALALTAGVIDGRGISIVGGSDACKILRSESYQNGDYTAAFSAAYEGSGIEGFASDGVEVMGCHLWGQGAAMEVKSSADNWKIHGNLARGLSYVLQWGDYLGTGSTGLVLENNTIVLENPLPFGLCLGLSSGNCTVRNNIFKTARSDFPSVSIRNTFADINLATIVMDYNLHYGSGTEHVWFQDSGHNQAYTVAQLQAVQAALSVHSIDNIDPHFVGQYEIGLDSPAYRTGAYLDGVRDFYGRKLRNPPDIGALQYFASRTAVSPKRLPK